MAYTAQQLITRAFYLSQVRSRGLNTPTGDDISTGLYLLNELLDWKAYDTTLIPYWTYYSFNAVVNQETYEIPNLYEVESVTFNNDTVRYPMDSVSRKTYFATARADDISSLPFSWYFLRQTGGGTLYMYFLPSDTFEIKLMGKFALTDVALNTDISEVYDGAYIAYLRHALAEYICSEYGKEFHEEGKESLKRIVRQLMYVSPPDLTLRKSSVLASGLGLNYAIVNFGPWLPSG